MGTRAQAMVKGKEIYLYQHYDGYDLFNTVVNAVVNAVDAGRFDDDEYLTRMIFCEMVKYDVMGSTGFGIGTEIHGDIEYLVVVDNQKGQVFEKSIKNGKWTKRFSVPSGKIHNLIDGDWWYFSEGKESAKIKLTKDSCSCCPSPTYYYNIRDKKGRFAKDVTLAKY